MLCRTKYLQSFPNRKILSGCSDRVIQLFGQRVSRLVRVIKVLLYNRFFYVRQCFLMTLIRHNTRPSASSCFSVFSILYHLIIGSRGTSYFPEIRSVALQRRADFRTDTAKCRFQLPFDTGNERLPRYFRSGGREHRFRQ